MGVFALILVVNYSFLLVISVYVTFLSLRIKFKANQFREPFWEVLVDRPSLDRFSNDIVTAGGVAATMCCIAGLMLSLPGRPVKKDRIIIYDTETKQSTIPVLKKNSSLDTLSDDGLPTYIVDRMMKKHKDHDAEKKALSVRGNNDYGEEVMEADEEAAEEEDETGIEGDSKKDGAKITPKSLFSSFDDLSSSESVSLDLKLETDAAELPENIFLASCRRFPHLGLHPVPGLPRMRNSLLSGTGGRPLFLDQNYVPVIWEIDTRQAIIIVNVSRSNHLELTRWRRKVDVFLMTIIVLSISIAMIQIFLAYEYFEMRLVLYKKWGPNFLDTEARNQEKTSAFQIKWSCDFHNITLFPRIIGSNSTDCADLFRSNVADLKKMSTFFIIVPCGCFLFVVIVSLSSYTKDRELNGVQTQPEDNWLHGCGGTMGMLRDVGIDCKMDVYDAAPDKYGEPQRNPSIIDVVRQASQKKHLRRSKLLNS